MDIELDMKKKSIDSTEKKISNKAAKKISSDVPEIKKLERANTDDVQLQSLSSKRIKKRTTKSKSGLTSKNGEKSKKSSKSKKNASVLDSKKVSKYKSGKTSKSKKKRREVYKFFVDNFAQSKQKVGPINSNEMEDMRKSRLSFRELPEIFSPFQTKVESNDSLNALDLSNSDDSLDLLISKNVELTEGFNKQMDSETGQDLTEKNKILPEVIVNVN